jgi:outer membrane lipoprotein-sorting protein
MEKLQKIFFGIGAVLLVFIPVWLFLIVPELEKMPEDYSRAFDYNSITDTRHEISAEWAGKEVTKARLQDDITNSAKEIQTVKSLFEKKTLAGEVLWKIEHKFKLDRYTLEVMEGNGKASRQKTYYIFPKKTEGKTYRIWVIATNNLYDLKFTEIENILGLETYHFSAEDSIVDDTEGFEWLELVPERYDVKSNQSINMWVEPVSGITVKLEDKGTSFYTDPKSGELIHAMQTWDNKFNDDTISNQVRLAQNEKQRIILIERIIPILLFIIAAALFIAAHWGGGRSQK